MGVTFFDVTNVTKNRKQLCGRFPAYQPITRASEFFVTFFSKYVTL